MEKKNAKILTRFMLSQKLLLLRMVEKSGTMTQMQLTTLTLLTTFTLMLVSGINNMK